MSTPSTSPSSIESGQPKSPNTSLYLLPASKKDKLRVLDLAEGALKVKEKVARQEYKDSTRYASQDWSDNAFVSPPDQGVGGDLSVVRDVPVRLDTYKQLFEDAMADISNQRQALQELRDIVTALPDVPDMPDLDPIVNHPNLIDEELDRNQQEFDADQFNRGQPT